MPHENRHGGTPYYKKIRSYLICGNYDYMFRDCLNKKELRSDRVKDLKLKPLVQGIVFSMIAKDTQSILNVVPNIPKFYHLLKF